MTTYTQPPQKKFAIYGFGGVGQKLVDDLLARGEIIDFIIDQHKNGQNYRGIAIISLSDLMPQNTQGITCLIALHNHYINLHDIYRSLSLFNFDQIESLLGATTMFSDIQPENGYWLDPSFDFKQHDAEIQKFIGVLADEKSKVLAKQIIEYRQTGLIPRCPNPSLEDEYAPVDLPRYRFPLRLIDCGAYTGVAIKKLLAAGYAIEALAAFEPDPSNFAQLVTLALPTTQTTFLPLGTWSSHTQLRFSGQGSMGSNINPAGESMIQCVCVDDVLPSFRPNIIKLDVEGAELETINGLRKTIHQHRPNLCISIYHKPTHLFELALLIRHWDLGYTFHLRVHEQSTFGTVLYCHQAHLTEHL